MAGRLAVESRETDPRQAGRVGNSAARGDISKGGIAAPNPMRDSVGEALAPAAAASTSAVVSPRELAQTRG